MSKTKINVTIIALFIHAIFLICGHTGNAGTIFFDDFNQNSLDESKWNIKLKYGSYRFLNGSLLLYSTNYSSSGDGFPEIYTKYNPFPIDSDWTLTTMMHYITSPRNFGDGMAIYDDQHYRKIAYVYQSNYIGRFKMWDSRENKEKIIWDGDTSDDSHKFSVKRNGDYYEGYVDGVLKGSVYNESDAGGLSFGNYDLAPVFGNWNPVSINYVDIAEKDPEIKLPPAPVPEPGSFIMTLAGITAVISIPVLRLRAGHSGHVVQ
ncbi:MAG: hypothetical protein HZA08_00530 [Nitrospirae bacterium]|nr:hypothetical protein [Nitrospirota bacterium]